MTHAPEAPSLATADHRRAPAGANPAQTHPPAQRGAGELLGERNADLERQMQAIHRVLAVIEFELDGTILDANANFLAAVGYGLAEIRGRHHSLFVLPEERGSAAYSAFWADLREGKCFSRQFRRVGKGGREIWIQASYNPILGDDGKPYRVVKFATDITEERLRMADFEGQLAAIDKSQAVIEFELDGTVRRANDNFLGAVGYTADEIAGRHHRMFVDPVEAGGAAYERFWRDLREGRFAAGEFRRIGKGGREVWIQASYNPILGLDGKPMKVVKYASDITATKRMQAKMHNILGEVQSCSRALVDASAKLSAAGDVLSASVGQTNEDAGSASVASEEVARSVEAVAAAMEQMDASLREIAKNVRDAAAVSVRAVAEARSAESTVAALGASAEEISSVIKSISAIAGQTNLLALNATIEAARAGESGKGFAVVASEVKELAKATAKATEEIGVKLAAIQGGTKGSVKAIAEIAGIINQIDQFTSSIAGAVEQQTHTTAEISRAIGEVSSASGQIARSLHGVAESARGASEGTEHTRAASKELEGLASRLIGVVESGGSRE